MDITQLLVASKDDIRQLSAVTRTPLPILMPDNTNQSAAGAVSAETGYVSKCIMRLMEAKTGGEAILVKALETEKAELGDLPVSIQFEHVERVSLSEKYAAVLQGTTAGMARKTVLRDALGYGPEEIAQDALDQAAEALQALALLPPPPSETSSSKVQLTLPLNRTGQ